MAIRRRYGAAATASPGRAGASKRRPAAYARGDYPVQRRNARLKLLVSENPSRYAISVIDSPELSIYPQASARRVLVDHVLKGRVALRQLHLQRARAHVQPRCDIFFVALPRGSFSSSNTRTRVSISLRSSFAR